MSPAVFRLHGHRHIFGMQKTPMPKCACTHTHLAGLSIALCSHWSMHFQYVRQGALLDKCTLCLDVSVSMFFFFFFREVPSACKD